MFYINNYQNMGNTHIHKWIVAFEQFVPSNKGKLVNGQCFESFMGE